MNSNNHWIKFFSAVGQIRSLAVTILRKDRCAKANARRPFCAKILQLGLTVDTVASLFQSVVDLILVEIAFQLLN